MKMLLVDPMSRNNLGVYDENLIKNINSTEIIFYCNKEFQFENIENVKTIREYDYHKKKSIFKILSYLKSQYKLLQLVKNIDILHFQWFKIPLIDYLLIKQLKKNKNLKVILTAHNVLPHDTGMKYYKIYKKIYNLLDGIIVHTQRTKDEIINKFTISGKKIEVIPHGLLENNISKEKRTEKKLKIREKNEIIFSLTGALNNYKGVDLLIEAWSSDQEIYSNKNIKLVIAGKGNVDFSTIKNKKNVIIINRFLSEDELEEVMEETDVAVLPYRKISQSGVLLSILAKKKPILVSDVGGLTQPFELGNLGWIMEEVTSKELLKKIREIVSQKEKIEKIKNDEQLWTKISNYYSWEEIGKKTQKFYERKENEDNNI